MAPALDLAAWDRAKIVSEDLAYFAEQWSPTLEEAALRRESPMLRRLLVDNEYGRSWKALGLPGTPYVSATVLEESLGTVNRAYLHFALAPPSHGVATLFDAFQGEEKKVQMAVLRESPAGSVVGMPIDYPRTFGLMYLSVPPDVVEAAGGYEETKRRHLTFGRRVVKAHKLPDYLASPAAIVLGTSISRQDVIQYVANKLGGVHYDTTRDRRRDARFALLDKINTVTSMGTDVTDVYVELFSIAEALGESGDVARYREAFAKTPKPTT